jgi:hypothetical protein
MVPIYETSVELLNIHLSRYHAASKTSSVDHGVWPNSKNALRRTRDDLVKHVKKLGRDRDVLIPFSTRHAAEVAYDVNAMVDDRTIWKEFNTSHIHASSRCCCSKLCIVMCSRGFRQLPLTCYG